LSLFKRLFSPVIGLQNEIARTVTLLLSLQWRPSSDVLALLSRVAVLPWSPFPSTYSHAGCRLIGAILSFYSRQPEAARAPTGPPLAFCIQTATGFGRLYRVSSSPPIFFLCQPWPCRGAFAVFGQEEAFVFLESALHVQFVRPCQLFPSTAVNGSQGRCCGWAPQRSIGGPPGSTFSLPPPPPVILPCPECRSLASCDYDLFDSL